MFNCLHFNVSKKSENWKPIICLGFQIDFIRCVGMNKNEWCMVEELPLNWMSIDLRFTFGLSITGKYPLHRYILAIADLIQSSANPDHQYSD